MKRYLNLSARNGLHIGMRPTKRHMVIYSPKGMSSWESHQYLWNKLQQDGYIVLRNMALFDGDEDYQWCLTDKGRLAMGFPAPVERAETEHFSIFETDRGCWTR